MLTVKFFPRFVYLPIFVIKISEWNKIHARGLLSKKTPYVRVKHIVITSKITSFEKKPWFSPLSFLSALSVSEVLKESNYKRDANSQCKCDIIYFYYTINSSSQSDTCVCFKIGSLNQME